jgi:3-hydroxyacyl-CoA dehydrogenase
MEYPEITKVCCYGAGTIGAGWATGCSLKGHPVTVYDLDEACLGRARSAIAKNYAPLVAGGVLTAAEATRCMSLVTYVGEPAAALDGVQLILESAPERHEVKKQVLETIDRYRQGDVIVGSSSSSLLASEMSRFSKYPERCICAHPYNPVHLIPLVELVGPPGSEDAIEHVRGFLASIGKEPVVLKKEAKGYIANRFQVVVGREIVELLKRGVCTVEDADKALTFGPGIRWAVMGHLLNMELGFAGGVKGMYDKLIVPEAEHSSYLNDLGNWTKYPDDLAETAQAGVDEELAHRPPEIGNDVEGLAEYRDRMLIEILKLHKRL